MINFFTAHPAGVGLILGIVFFPRLTLLAMLVFTGFVSGGILWWLGFFFMPRLLVAFLSLPYWHTNPVLVFSAWVIALFGEVFEKKVFYPPRVIRIVRERRG